MTAQFGPKEVETLSMNETIVFDTSNVSSRAPLEWMQSKELSELQVSVLQHFPSITQRNSPLENSKNVKQNVNPFGLPPTTPGTSMYGLSVQCRMIANAKVIGTAARPV